MDKPGKPDNESQPALSDEERAFAAWNWPLMETPKSSEESNVLGYAPNWYEESQGAEEEELPPEPEQQPLTLEEIEAIRQAAYEDGFAEGREAGFNQGQEEGKLAGLQQGHAIGLEQGQAEGLAMGQSLIAEQLSHWQAMLGKLAQPMEQVDIQVEQQLVWLAMMLAKSLIKQEVHTSPDLLLGSLKEAVKQLPCAEEGVTLELHPDDLAMVLQAYGEEACQKRGWTLVAEPALQRGDLQLTSRTSSIDLLLEQRIENLLRNFLRTNADRGL